MKEKFDRTPYENKIYDFLKKGRKQLEAFTEWDYYIAGSDAIWKHASVLIKKLPNYKLKAICENIDNESKFDSYYKIFQI